MEIYLGEIPIYTIILAGGRAMLFFPRHRSSTNFFRRPPACATIVIMPRRGKYWMRQITTGTATGFLPGRRNTINGGASISDRRRRRRGIAEGEEWGELKNNLSIPNPNHQRTYCALLCLIAVRRGVCLRSCFVWKDPMPRATVKVDIYGGLNP